MEIECQHDKLQYGVLPYAMKSKYLDAVGHLMDFNYVQSTDEIKFLKDEK